MHRTFELISQKLQFTVQDPLIFFPDGGVTPWMPGMEYLVAVPLYILGLKDVKDVAAACILVVPLFSLPMIWCIKPVLSRYTQSFAVRVVTYMSFVFLPSMVLLTSLGRFDHHLFEAMQVLMMLALYYAQLKPQKKQWLWVCFFAFSWFVWPHAWMLCVLILPLAFYENNRAELQVLLKAFLITFVVEALMLLCLVPEYFFAGKLSLFGISWWTPMVSLGTAVVLFDFVRFQKRPSTERFRYVPILTVTSFIFCGVVFREHVFILGKSLYMGITANHGTLANTLETLGAYEYAKKVGWAKDTTMIMIMPLMMLFLFRKKHYRGLVVYAVLPCLLYFFQVRFMSMLFPLFAVIMALFFYEISHCKLAQKLYRVPKMQTLFYLFLISLFFLPLHGSLGRAYPNNYRYFYHIKRASQFLAQESKRLDFDPRTSGVGARWMYGHWILLYTGMPVAATPFQGQSGIDYAEFLYGRGEQGLTDYIARYPVRYILMVNATREHMNQFLFFHPDQPDIIELKDNTMIVKDGFLELRSSRFLFENAMPYVNNIYGGWRVVYASNQKVDTKSNEYSDIKVFERVKGARIEILTDQDELILTGLVKVAPKEKISIHLQPTREGDVLVWKVPYGKYEQAGVEFSGQYDVKGNNNSTLVSVMVTEADVLEGRKILVDLKK